MRIEIDQDEIIAVLKAAIRDVVRAELAAATAPEPTPTPAPKSLDLPHFGGWDGDGTVADFDLDADPDDAGIPPDFDLDAEIDPHA